MSWQTIARKEFQDSIRSYWLWGLSTVYVLAITVVSVGAYYLLREILKNVTSSDVLRSLNLFVTVLIPLIALVMSMASISGERESGSLKLMLSLPHSREDLVVGKFLGRSVTIVIATALGFVLPAIFLLLKTEFRPLDFLGYVLFVMVLGVIFTGIGTAISSLTTTQWRSVAAGLSFYFVFTALWVLLQLLLLAVISFILGGALTQAWPGWMPVTFEQFNKLLRVVNPSGSFKILSGAFLAGEMFAKNPSNALGRQWQISAVLMLLFWTVAPLALGLWRFRNADL